MQSHLVMTVLGKDRPGLVESLAAIVAGHGGNWLESRMTHLGGYFAGVLRVQIPKDNARALLDALPHLQQQGLTIVAHDDAADTAPAAGTPMRLEIVGHDRPGIVRQIARTLATRQINVEDLHTERVSAPMSGEMLFKANARVVLPPQCPVDSLRAELEKIAADLVVEIRVRQPE